MLMVAERANTDRPPIGFCILFLLGSKYARVAFALRFIGVAFSMV